MYILPYNLPRWLRGGVYVGLLLYSFFNIGRNEVDGQPHALAAVTPGMTW